MSDGDLLVTIVVILAILAFTAPLWFGDVIAGGRRHMGGRKSKTFRQYPTFHDEEE